MPPVNNETVEYREREAGGRGGKTDVCVCMSVCEHIPKSCLEEERRRRRKVRKGKKEKTAKVYRNVHEVYILLNHLSFFLFVLL